MPQGKLSAFIAEYIATRRQAKLEVFDKEAAKRRAANAADEATLLQERRALEERYIPVNWLTDAALRTSQISLVSHVAKFTHGDSKSSSVYSRVQAAEGYLNTASLAKPAIDAVGNAAALDVAKLLQTEVEGDSLLACLQRQDYQPLEPFATRPGQLEEWVKGFNQALITREPASHKLAKQIYFPVGESYHLLSPLFSSSLAHALHQKMVALRFSDEAKAAREAYKNKRAHTQPMVIFPGTAEMHFGGTKPQNISSLNSGRGGRVSLLNAQPPRWKRLDKAPAKLNSVFTLRGEFDREASGALRHLSGLLTRAGDYNNRAIRQACDQYIDEIIDILFNHAADLQRREWLGWSRNCSGLSAHQQLWLDPWRALEDKAFRLERDKDDWQKLVAADFARWLNYRLSRTFQDVGKTELHEWETRPLFRQRLREMESILREGSI